MVGELCNFETFSGLFLKHQLIATVMAEAVTSTGSSINFKDKEFPPEVSNVTTIPGVPGTLASSLSEAEEHTLFQVRF